MRIILVLLLTMASLTSTNLHAATQFISDKIYLDTYDQPNEQATVAFEILSGTAIEIISIDGDYSNIKNREGKTGWINNKYLTTEKPSQIAYLQTRKKYDTVLAKLQDLKSNKVASKNSAKSLKALNKTKKELKALKGEKSTLEKLLSQKTDSLNKSIGAINVLTKELQTIRDKNKLDITNDESKTVLPDAFTLSITWTIAALVLVLVIGFTLGIKWLEHKISKRHGGVKIY